MIARAIIDAIRLVPAIVTVGFACWALVAAAAGDGAIAAGAAAMSALALSVAVRSSLGRRSL